MTIKIRNWDKWQSYRKDRGQPPWIKLWRCLLRNPDFLLLTDAQRGQLMCLWILAADHNGVINMTPDEIVRVCGMSSALDLNVLRDRRFIEFGVTAASRRRQADATLAPSWRHGDASESESEAEAEKIPLPAKPKTARQASLAAVSTATQVIGRVNDKFGLERGATPTLIRAVEILLRAGHTEADILLVVGHRLVNEDWFDPKKHGAESLIRRDKFPSMLQVAKDAPRPEPELEFEPEPWRN
jgi:hypothetical protein